MLLAAGSAIAQGRPGRAAGRGVSDWCGSQPRTTYCEHREDSLVGLAEIDVDASPNGGISVRGADRADVYLRTRITAHADTEAAARELASQVRVMSDNGRIRAEGPSNGDGQYWSASFEIEVPRYVRLQLTAKNGGIAIADFDGYGRFDTTNGGVSLSNVGGDLKGATVNGGVSVRLSGTTWNGAGLDVQTRNGGVTMSLPDSFNAQLDISTVNGGVNSDVPVSSNDQTTSRTRHISATLGAGGAPLHVNTVNGGIRINQTK
jgi:hypothetical protein